MCQVLQPWTTQQAPISPRQAACWPESGAFQQLVDSFGPIHLPLEDSAPGRTHPSILRSEGGGGCMKQTWL